MFFLAFLKEYDIIKTKDGVVGMTIGDRIKKLRTDAGLTQSELAEAIGVKTPAVYKYENGLVVNLKRSTVADLARVLHTTPSFLMGFDEIDEVDSRKLQELTDVYFSVAKEAQDAQVDPNDISAFIKLLAKNRERD